MLHPEGDEMDYDVIVIGAGAGGEAAGNLGGELGGRVAVVERDLVGGECGFWACMPSKSLLDTAARHAAGTKGFDWQHASDRRDYMISREGIDYPNDAGHVAALESAGAEVIRGEARIVGKGRVEVRLNGGGAPRTLEASNLIVSSGSVPFVPPLEGLEEAGYWTNREATALRDLPSSIVVLGGGPIGVELAQVYIRFGVKTVLVESNDRLLPRDHPLSSEHVERQLREERLDIRTGVKAMRVRTGGAGRIVELSDGSSVEGAELLVAVGRRPSDLRAMGIEEAGVELDERGGAKPDDRMRVADGVFVAGDAAGGLQFTHIADYEGRVAVRTALGQDARSDLSAVPRCTYCDPEVGAVGMTVPEAQAAGIDAFEVTQDFAVTARGYTIEGSHGHITAVVDRERKVLAGAFAACPGAAELIHEAVLAIKVGVPLDVLADTIHGFPTASRVFGNVVADALKELG